MTTVITQQDKKPTPMQRLKAERDSLLAEVERLRAQLTLRMPPGWVAAPTKPLGPMIAAASNIRIEQDRGGEQVLFPSELTAIYMAMIGAAPNCPGDPGWISVKDRLPDCNVEVLAGYWYQDTWRKGAPWVFSIGVCRMIPEKNRHSFPEGKRWLTHGCSHNQIQFWLPMLASPPRPADDPVSATEDED